jgi:transcriptional regulator with XRE-family HTH domain
MKPDARENYNPDPDYFRSLVESLPMTQGEIAARLGCTDRAIRLWMHGQRRISYQVQFALESLVLEP